MPLASGCGNPPSQNNGNSLAAQQVLADQPGRQVGDAEPGQRSRQQRFSIVGHHPQTPRAQQLRSPVSFEAPGVRRGQRIPVEAIMFRQLLGVSGTPRRSR